MNGQDYLLEACCDSVERALEAVNTGADRIEFCSRLDLDGLTPSISDTEQLFASLPPGFPVHIMIRCRSGDFVYTAQEIDQMLDQIRQFLSKFSCDSHLRGFVFGSLTTTVASSTHSGSTQSVSGEEIVSVNVEDLQKVLALIKPSYSLTFHRAFDLVTNKKEELIRLAELGVDRILTSGGLGKAVDHLASLKELISVACNRLTVIVAGGVRSYNAEEILEVTKAKELHSSAVWRKR